MNLALLIEFKLNNFQGRSSMQGHKFIQSGGDYNSISWPTMANDPQSSRGNNSSRKVNNYQSSNQPEVSTNKASTFKRLTMEERKLRGMGLCFNCKEKSQM